MEKIVLSPSRVRRWIRCKKSYYWRYYQHLVRVEKETAPTLGLVVGKALADYYCEGDRNQSLLDKSLESSLNHYKFRPEVDTKLAKDWAKVTRVSKHLLSTYHEWASSRDDFKVIHVETPQQVELTPYVSLLAIPDTIVKVDSEDNLVLEHKVRYRYRPGDFGIDYQSVGSCLVSNSIGTLYNVLEYGKLKLHRELIVRSSYELDYFRDIFIHIGEDILSTPPEELYPQPFKRCSCEYWELCNGEMMGIDVDNIISELYQKSVRPREIKEESNGKEGGE